MSVALRSRLEHGMLRPGECHAEWLPYRQPSERPPRGVVVGLSHNALVPGYFQAPYDDEVRAIASAGMPVVVPGSSGTSWGNDDAVESIDRAVRHLRTRLGCLPQVSLLGFSMGALAVCAWAREHADEVAAIALVTPALDLDRLRAGRIYGDEIDRAHRACSPCRDRHDPIALAEHLRHVPVRIWCSSDDPIVPPDTAAAFASRHGSTTIVDLGAVGHDPAAAPGDDLAQFLATA